MEALGGAAASLTFEDASECNVDAVLELLSKVVVDDSALGNISIESMKADIENQLAQAKQLYQQRVEQAGSAEATTPTRGATLAQLQRQVPLSDALKMVRSDIAPFNWLLVTADPTRPEIVNAGSGSVNEMCQSFRDDQVYFGMLRMGFGRSVFRRCKWIFIHWSGEGVGAVKRGKANSAEQALRKLFGPTNLDHFAASREECSVEMLIDKVKKFVVTDGEASDDVDQTYSMENFLSALEEEVQKAEEEFAAEIQQQQQASAPSTPVGGADPAAPPSFAVALESVRADDEPYNWLLATL